MFAFFPWLILHDEEYEDGLEFGRFKLLRYISGIEPEGNGSSNQRIIDETLTHYIGRNDQPVATATLIAIDGEVHHDSFDARTTQELFTFVDILTFGGLAAREFFVQIGNQLNSTCFDLHIQGYANPKFGLVIRSRRRDARQVSLGVSRFYCPHYALGLDRIRLDRPLIQALIRIHSRDDRNKYEQAIRLFNEANTDSDQKRDYEEYVQTVSAFEVLLETRKKSKERRLGEAFAEGFRSAQDVPDIPVNRILRTDGTQKRYGQVIAVREIWMRDCYIWRGYFAHGEVLTDWEKITRERHHILTPDKHLILMNYAFPRLVKALLSAEEDEKGPVYFLTEGDRDEIDVFEELVCLDYDVLQRELDKYADTNLWRKTISECKRQGFVRRATAKYLGDA